MGKIRKTLSISTIGLISFRSKKERLERAEHAQLKAEAKAAKKAYEDALREKFFNF